jgi:hypothetical protein
MTLIDEQSYWRAYFLNTESKMMLPFGSPSAELMEQDYAAIKENTQLQALFCLGYYWGKTPFYSVDQIYDELTEEKIVVLGNRDLMSAYIPGRLAIGLTPGIGEVLDTGLETYEFSKGKDVLGFEMTDFDKGFSGVSIVLGVFGLDAIGEFKRTFALLKRASAGSDLREATAIVRKSDLLIDLTASADPSMAKGIRWTEQSSRSLDEGIDALYQEARNLLIAAKQNGRQVVVEVGIGAGFSRANGLANSRLHLNPDAFVVAFEGNANMFKVPGGAKAKFTEMVRRPGNLADLIAFNKNVDSLDEIADLGDGFTGDLVKLVLPYGSPVDHLLDTGQVRRLLVQGVAVQTIVSKDAILQGIRRSGDESLNLILFRKFQDNGEILEKYYRDFPNAKKFNSVSMSEFDTFVDEFFDNTVVNPGKFEYRDAYKALRNRITETELSSYYSNALPGKQMNFFTPGADELRQYSPFMHKILNSDSIIVMEFIP